jgi:drug/metabolite transporter (DMT)-like permease
MIAFHMPLPDPDAALLIVLTGFFTFGLGLVCLIESLRSLGAAVTAAYYATAPLIGTFAALALFFEVPGPSSWYPCFFLLQGWFSW